ncbi:hypothetical protein OHA38_25950 [Streptomyces sp. NBC_01732]|uniref:hypothetical protein n=1 Tax=Streptomyces sp. NBC_01732 TaxID=2975926 RepID=UPI00352E9F3F|nr:hypothetical protein OHA38_25950 [Streptomyces sp. NBC_01732]
MTFRCPAGLTAPLLLLALLTGCGRDTDPAASPEPRAARPAPVAGSATTPSTALSASSVPPAPAAAPPSTPASPHPATTAPEPRTPPPVRPTAGTTPAAPAPARTPAPVARTGGGGGGRDARATGTTLRIGGWSSGVVRGGQETIDACRDAVQWSGPDFGQEDGYKMRTLVVVGHDYCGFGQFATLPVGTVVTVETPREILRYRVYARHLTPGRGTPAHGLYWGDLTLQSCVGPDTGFSYLVRT